MKDIDILIFIEHTDREMQGTVAVKKYLEKNTKLDVKVFSIEYGFFDAWHSYNPKLICLPYCKSEENLIVRAFRTRNPNTIFLNLNYEQIFNKTTIVHKRPRDKFAQKDAYHFAWGQQFQEYLQNYGVPNSHIFVTGKPEIQFLMAMKHSGRNIKTEIAEKTGLDAKKDWCFIPLNDASAFLSEEFIREKIRQGKSSEAALESHRCANKQIKILLKWLGRLFKEENSEDMEIVLRPHPGVAVENYNEIFEEMKINQPKNLHILREYTVKEWLCCSAICISNWSTVVIDAASIGVKTYIFEPEPIPDCMQADWIDAFTKIKNYNFFKQVFLGTDMEEETAQGCEKIFVDTSIDAVSSWAEAMYTLTCLYRETEPTDKHTFLEGLKKEWKRMIRSKLRCMAQKSHIGKSKINEKIRYDFFEPF